MKVYIGLPYRMSGSASAPLGGPPVLRSAVRLVLEKRNLDLISDDLSNQLHWLPIRRISQYKLGVLVYKWSFILS